MAVQPNSNIYYVADWSTNPDDFNPSTTRGQALIEIKEKLLATGLKEEDIVFGTTVEDLNNGANVFLPNWANNRPSIGGEELLPEAGHTVYFINIDRTGTWDLRDDSYDVYIDGAKSGTWLHGLPSGNPSGIQGMHVREGEGYTPVRITVKNSTFNTPASAWYGNDNRAGLYTFGKETQDVMVYSDVIVTIEKSTMQHFNLGTGAINTDQTWWHGCIYGDLDFTITGSQFTDNANANYVTKGGFGTADKPVKITGVISDSTFAGSFNGIMNASGWPTYGDYDLTLNAVTFNGCNVALAHTIKDDALSDGDNVMRVSGSTAQNFYGWLDRRSSSSEGKSNSYALVINSNEKDLKTIATAGISHFDTITINENAKVEGGAISTDANGTITVNAGSDVRATSISADNGVLNLQIGALLNVGSIAVQDFNVTGELVGNDIVLVTGISSLLLGNEDQVINVNGVEYKNSIFPGGYEIVGTNLIIHNAASIVFLVNSNYTDGEITSLGPKGYSTFAAAQAAVTDKANTTIMASVLDEEVEEGVFTADVVTKDYVTSFVGSSDTRIDFGGNSIIIGDTAADTATANVSISYTNYIKNVSFGNITEGAEVLIDNSESIESIDLTGASIVDADIAVSGVTVGDLKLDDNAASTGKIEVSNSVITTVTAGAGKIEADLTGGNTITTVYAETLGSKLKLAGSEVETYWAGSSTEGTVIDTLTYNDGVSAENLIIGGNANKITKIDATFTGGGATNLYIGSETDTVGSADVNFAGGKFTDVMFGNITGKADVTFSGGTVALAPAGTFNGLIYGASVTGTLDGGSIGDKVVVDGHAKVGAITGFKSLEVTGGTLNVAGGDTHKSALSNENKIEIDGDILNRRAIQAGFISAKNLNNYGLVGTLLEGDQSGISLTGTLYNEGYVKVSQLSAATLTNKGKITSVGDITIDSTADFVNSGEIYFKSTSDSSGKFTQEGGLKLNEAGVNMVNEGFISAGTLTGVKNLTTSKMYVTGGASISGNITIDAGAEVAFTNKANESATALELGGTITMGDTSHLVVSGVLNSGNKTLTVNVGDLIGVTELVRTEGGLESWTINLVGDDADQYDYAINEEGTSLEIWSLGELYVNSEFAADAENKVDGNTLLYGVNAFASVEDAIAFAKAQGLADSTIVIANDTTGMTIDAADYNIGLMNSTVGAVLAKNLYVGSDSTAAMIAGAKTLVIDADARLTVSTQFFSADAIVIDASDGSGSRLVLDVNKNVVIDPATVTVISPDGKAKPYEARILGGSGAHAGDLYIVSADNVYFRKDMTLLPPAEIVDGESFDAATGDALFNNVNVFGSKDAAVAAAQEAGGTMYLVGFTAEDDIRAVDGVLTAFEFASSTASLAGTEGTAYGTPEEASKIEHVTVLNGTEQNGTIYGLNQYVNMDADYTFIANGVRQSGADTFIMGNTTTNVMNGNITATINDSSFDYLYIGAGNFGTKEEEPITIDVTITNSTIAHGFYAFTTENNNNDPEKKQVVNADVTVKIYDSVINGGTVTFFHTNNDNYSGEQVTQLQTYLTAGSLTLELGNVNMPDGNIRIGGDLEVAGKAFQAFNVPNTVHIVATEKGSVTRCDWVCDVDTLIVDANAQLLIDNAMQYTTVDKNSSNPIDNGGSLTQVMINMSGYKSGTHKVIQANYSASWGGTDGIYTDANLSNITVIGDNDLTGQCELAYSMSGSNLNAIYIFDKTDNMYVNSDYTDAINGTAPEGQELLLHYNAFTSFDVDNGRSAIGFATKWGGDIIVTGGNFVPEGEYGLALDFQGNNVEVRNAVFGAVTLNAAATEGKEAAAMKVTGAKFASLDGSKSATFKSTLDVVGDNDLGNVSNFSAISLEKGADLTVGAFSDSNVSMYAGSTIKADSLDLTDGSITIDVTGYTDRSYAVISTTKGITGFSADKITLKGNDEGKFSVVQVDNDLVLRSEIKSDTFLNSAYTEGFKTVLEDGSYLEYGLNAFDNAADASANLGNTKGRQNTLTVTGGETSGDVHLNGANFVMMEGSLAGVVYGIDEDIIEGMSITIDSGSVGGISLAKDAFMVKKANISLGEGVTVNGNIIGAGDTTLTAAGDLTLTGGMKGISSLSIQTDSLLKVDSLDIPAGGVITITGNVLDGNVKKVISTTAGITGITDDTFKTSPGTMAYQSGQDIYLLDLSRIYYDPNWTIEEIDNTVFAETGDTLRWGVNAFNELGSATWNSQTKSWEGTGAIGALVDGGTLIVRDSRSESNGGNIRPPQEVSLDIRGNDGRATVTSGQGGARTIDSDISIVIDTPGTNQGGTPLLSNTDGNNRKIYNGDVTVTLKNNFENGSNDFAVARYTRFNGNVKVILDGAKLRNSSERLAFFRDFNTDDFRNTKSLDIIVTGITTGNQTSARRIMVFNGGADGGRVGSSDYKTALAVMTIKDSVFTSSNNSWYFSYSYDGSSDNLKNSSFTIRLDNAYIDGTLSGIRSNGIPGAGSDYNGLRKLQIVGGDNYVYDLNSINQVEIDANASLTVGHMARFLEGRSNYGGNTLTVDVSTYTGSDKMLLACEDWGGDYAANAPASITMIDSTVDDIANSKYFIGFNTNHGAYLVQKGGDVIYGANLSSMDNGLLVGEAVVYAGDSDLVSGAAEINTFNDFSDAKAELAKRAGRSLFVAGSDGAEKELFDVGNTRTGIADGEFAQVYGTDVTIYGGSYGNLTAASTSGDVKFTILGGTFGSFEIIEPEDDPATEEIDESEGEPEVVKTRSEINGGAKGSGLRSLTISGVDRASGEEEPVVADNALLANISNFDTLLVDGSVTFDGSITVDAMAVVAGGVTVDGDITATSLTIDCTTIEAGKAMTIDGDLAVGSIHLISDGYVGPSKLVASSEALKTFDITKITADGTDRPFIDKNGGLWLISTDPGNVYISSEYNSALIDGTTTKDNRTGTEDLLIYGVNAFDTIPANIDKLTSTDYGIYILDGEYTSAEGYDISGIGQIRVRIDGGHISSLKIDGGSGTVSDLQSRIEITGKTSSVKLDNVTNVDGASIGYRLIADESEANVTLGTVSGVGYVRIDPTKTTASQIDFVPNGGSLVIDMKNIDAAGTVFQTTGGINNFLKETTVVTSENNNAGLMLYYDDTKKAVIAANAGNIGIVANGFTALDNGKFIVLPDGTTTSVVQVYGYNASNSLSTVANNLADGGSLYIDSRNNSAVVSNKNFKTVVVTNSTLSSMQFGYTAAEGQNTRTGNFDLTVTNSSIVNNDGDAAIAGRGTADNNRLNIVVGELDESGEITNGEYNIVITGSSFTDNGATQGERKIRISNYAAIGGGVVNFTVAGTDEKKFVISSDIQLFDHSKNYNGKQLETLNVTLSNVILPTSKWWSLWDPEEDNATNLNVTITGSTFSGGDVHFGLFGSHVSNWTGKATVTISGSTFTGGAELIAGRGDNGHSSQGVLGVRELIVKDGTSVIDDLRDFTTIDVASDSLLKANTVRLPTGTASLMPEGTEIAVILRGDVDAEGKYTGGVREYISVSDSISYTGSSTITVKFLDAEGDAIEDARFGAAVGSKGAFVYSRLGDVYYNSGYSATVNGTVVTENEATNYLVFGDNAVNKMADAFAAVDERKTLGVDATIQVMGTASGSTLYTNGYRTVVNAGSIKNLFGGGEWTVVPAEIDPETGDVITPESITPAEAVASADLTVKKTAAVKNITVANENSQVSGVALVTIDDGATISEVIDGGNEFVGGEDKLVFNGSANAGTVKGFDSVSIMATGIVSLANEFSGTSITIDATGFVDFTKKVMTVGEGVFDTAAITVDVVNAGEGMNINYMFSEDKKTLLVTSNQIGDVYLNSDYTPETVNGTYAADGVTALLFGQNAFATVTEGTGLAGKGKTLFIEKGAFTDAITMANGSNVSIAKDVTGVGAISTVGTITVEDKLTADSFTGISALSVKAEALTVTNGISLFVDEVSPSTITIDMTGFKLAAGETDAVVLSTGTGITGLEDNKQIVLTGEGAGAFYGYYDVNDNDIHVMKIDNFYVNTDWGTAGENLPEGAVDPITGESLLFGVNAFYYLNDVKARITDGQGLYIYNRNNAVDTGSVQPSVLYIEDSTISRLVSGHTTSDGIKDYKGDLKVFITGTTLGTTTDANTLISNAPDYTTPNHVYGNIDVIVSDSTIGANNGQTQLLYAYDFTHVYGSDFVQYEGTAAPEGDILRALTDDLEASTVSISFINSEIMSDIYFIDDSQIGNPTAVNTGVVVEGSTVYELHAGASDLTINFVGVNAPLNKWWRIRGGSSNSHGTVTVNMVDSVIGSAEGDNPMRMRFAIEGNWGNFGGVWSSPDCSSDFIFNLTNVTFNGFLIAGRLDMGEDENDQDPEIPTYTGNRVLSVSGENFVNDVRWFKEINLTANDTLKTSALTMNSTSAAINIDVTDYADISRVLIVSDSDFANIGINGINVTGGWLVVDGEEIPEEHQNDIKVLTDYNATSHKAVSTIIVKGIVKDVYVNAKYDETLPFGTSYGPEALFFGENAFETIDDANKELTAGNSLVLTGGVNRATVLKSNSFTVDSAATLLYNGNTAITIDGEVVNDGSIIINVAGFVGGGDDVIVLTADMISGNGTITASNTSSFSIETKFNETTSKYEVHLLQNATNVFVNTEWAELLPGTEVEYEGKKYIVGSDAFGDAASAAAKVAANGTITVIASDVTFTAIENGVSVTATAGSIIHGAVGGIDSTGALTLQTGAAGVGLAVRGTGTLTVNSGVSVSGGLGMNENATVTFAQGSAFGFDISAQEIGPDKASVTNLSVLGDTIANPTYTLNISLEQKDGDYAVATNATGFASNVKLTAGETVLAEVLEFGKETKIDGVYYTLSLSDDKILTFTKKTSQDVIYVNSGWAGTAEGATVKIGEKEAIFGTNAFADGDSAVDKATAETTIQVVGGVASFTAGIVYPTQVLNSAEINSTDVFGSLTVGDNAKITGTAEFAPVGEAAITVTGTIFFDTAIATATEAQYTGLSKVGGAPKYELIDGKLAADTYLLATDADGFNTNVTFGEYTLAVGTTVEVQGLEGALLYTLDVNANKELVLMVIEKPVIPVTAAYVNSAWASQSGEVTFVSEVTGETVTATIGTDAFAALSAAQAITTVETIEVVGGEVSFTGEYNEGITVDSAASVTGAAAFDKAITINGTFVFSTAIATATKAQFSGFSFVSGTAAGYELVDATPAEGTYLLADGLTIGEDFGVQFNDVTLKVGETYETTDFNYTLGYADSVLSLTVESTGPTPPPPTPKTQVYVDSEWAGQSGEVTFVDNTGATVTATIGDTAFATLADASAAVADDGKIEVVGGEVSFTGEYKEGITVDAGAEITGAAVFDKAITVNGTFVFDTAIATATTAQFALSELVTGSASYKLLDTQLTAASYLLATGLTVGEGFKVAFNSTELTIGAAESVGNFIYTLGYEEGTLSLLVEANPEPPTVTKAYVDSSWGTTGTVTFVDATGSTVTATLGFDAFNTLTAAEAIETVTDIEVVGGEISFADGYSKTIVVDAGAEVIGAAVFDKPITINGTFKLTTDIATAESAQIKGFSNVTSGAQFILVDPKQTVGTYLLVDGFTAGLGFTVQFGYNNLTVGNSVTVGDLVYTLHNENSVLSLDVAAYVPPTPTQPTVYVDSAWANVADGTAVPAFVNADGELVTDAIKGVNAFANGDAASQAVTEDGKIEVVGGEVSFSAPITEALTIDEGATLTGKATFEAPVTINGGLVFDATLATEDAQFKGFENVTLGDNVQISLALGEDPEAGKKVILTDAPTVKTDKNQNPLYGKKVSVLGENDYEIGSAYFNAIGEVSYVLDLDKNGQLVLSEVAQQLRNNDNDNLIVNKQPDTHVIGENVPYTILTLENPEVFVDPIGEVKEEFVGGKTYYNYVDGTSDKIDYAQIVVEHGAKLVFTLESTDKAKITLYSVSTNSKGQWSKKSLKSASVTKANGTKSTAAVYVTGGTYYVAVSNSNKKTAGAFYNVELNTVSSYIYADADDNWNDYLVKSKALNPKINDLVLTEITASGVQDVQFDDTALTLSEDYDNFVGYSDTVDFAKLSAKQPVGLVFTLDATGKSALNVYKLTKNSKGVWTQSKSLKSVKVTAKAGGEKSTAMVYLDRLPASTGAEETGYYVSVTSTDKKGNVNYNVSVTSYVYEDSDFGTNGVLLVDKYTINDKLASTTINAASTPITTEVINGEDDITVSMEYNDKTYTSFVGFGDQYDYAEVVLNGTGNITLSLETYGTVKSTAKMMLYKLTLNSKGVWSKSTVGTLSVKTDGTYGIGEGSKTLKIKAASSDTVKYFVGVQSVDAAKGKEMYYNAYATFDGASSSALDMPQDDLLSIQTFDTLADTSAFVDSSLVDDKQFALQSVPGLIA